MDDIRNSYALKKVIKNKGLMTPKDRGIKFTSINQLKGFNLWIKHLMNTYYLKEEYKTADKEMKQYIQKYHNKYKFKTLNQLLLMPLPPKIPLYIRSITPPYMVDILKAYKLYDEATVNQQKLQIIADIVVKYRLLLVGDYTKILNIMGTDFNMLFYTFFELDPEYDILSNDLLKYFTYSNIHREGHQVFRACAILEDEGNPWYIKSTPIEKYSYEGLIIINIDKIPKLIVAYSEKINLQEIRHLYYTPLELKPSIVSGRINKSINFSNLRHIAEEYIRQIGESEFVDDKQTFVKTGIIYPYKQPQGELFLLSKMQLNEIKVFCDNNSMLMPQLTEYIYSETQKQIRIAYEINQLIATFGKIYKPNDTAAVSANTANKADIKAIKAANNASIEAFKNRIQLIDINTTKEYMKTKTNEITNLLKDQISLKPPLYCSSNRYDIGRKMYCELKLLYDSVEKMKMNIEKIPMYSNRNITKQQTKAPISSLSKLAETIQQRQQQENSRKFTNWTEKRKKIPDSEQQPIQQKKSSTSSLGKLAETVRQQENLHKFNNWTEKRKNIPNSEQPPTQQPIQSSPLFKSL